MCSKVRIQSLGFVGPLLITWPDTDGTGYLLTEDRANGLRIDLLSSDYLSVKSATYLYAQDYEAPALYKSGSTYFMFASHESGWGKFPPIQITFPCCRFYKFEVKRLIVTQLRMIISTVRQPH
jgi:hypothetical protein